MKTTVSVLSLLTAFALPAYAGEVIIEETDTAIIVEYTGDAGDKGAKRTAPQPQGNMQPAPPSQQAGAAAPPPPEATQDAVRSRRGTEEDEALRKARAERRAARRAGRSSGEGGDE